ncbi:MAG: YggT family protein [Eubacteriales bacterium]|nr:YggT family protein [Eubacteriales bacterium]
MYSLFYVLGYSAYYFLYVMEFALFLRALFSWFDPMYGSKIHVFLFNITEPVLIPIRKLFERLGWFSGLPIDMSFMFSYLIIIILQVLVRSML